MCRLMKTITLSRQASLTGQLRTLIRPPKKDQEQLAIISYSFLTWETIWLFQAISQGTAGASSLLLWIKKTDHSLRMAIRCSKVSKRLYTLKKLDNLQLSNIKNTDQNRQKRLLLKKGNHCNLKTISYWPGLKTRNLMAWSQVRLRFLRESTSAASRRESRAPITSIRGPVSRSKDPLSKRENLGYPRNLCIILRKQELSKTFSCPATW